MARAIDLRDGPDGLVHVEDTPVLGSGHIYVMCERGIFGNHFNSPDLKVSDARAPTCLWCARQPYAEVP